MALHFSSGCLCCLSQMRSQKIRGVAPESSVTVNSEEDKVKLGGSDLKVTKLGIGAWSWGDTSYWNNFEWDDKKLKAAKTAFDASIDCGITFIDTAEVYGSKFSFGAINSETLLGRFIKERKEKDPEVEIAVATKFAALPWRLGRQSVVAALKDSLARMELSSVDLYQLHWPGIWGNEGYIDGLGDAVEQGLVKAVGVSNYSEKRLRNAYEQLKRRGIPLASNQVNYSLIYRLPEQNGVKAACYELGVTLIAYSPIAQGALTGKYTPENPPTGPRGQIYTPEFLTKLQPLISRIKEIGESYNKTSTQIYFCQKRRRRRRRRRRKFNTAIQKFITRCFIDIMSQIQYFMRRPSTLSLTDIMHQIQYFMRRLSTLRLIVNFVKSSDQFADISPSPSSILVLFTFVTS